MCGPHTLNNTLPFSWRQISSEVFEKAFRLYPEAASIRLDDSWTALSCLCGASYNEEHIEAVTSPLTVYPEAVGIPDKYGSYQLHKICEDEFGEFHIEPPLVTRALLEAHPKLFITQKEIMASIHFTLLVVNC
jgi:hypothetical protein